MKPKPIHICTFCLEDITDRKRLFWIPNKTKNAFLLSCDECTEDQSNPYMKPRKIKYKNDERN